MRVAARGARRTPATATGRRGSSAMSAAAIGLAMASASRPPVATSSAVETTTLEKGSGLALTSVRAPALPAWATKRRAAAEQEAADLPGRVAAIDDREAEQRAAERPDEAVDRVPGAVDPGDLVGEEFGEGADARRCRAPNCWRARRAPASWSGSAIQPNFIAEAGDQRDEVEPPAGEQAGRGGEGDEFDGVHGRLLQRRSRPRADRSGSAIVNPDAYGLLLVDRAEPTPEQP